MDHAIEIMERRTSADVVFDFLYQEIVSLRLLPGAKISEADIANRFSISRQPVRDAFSRLGNLELLQIRPQRATEVKRFSSEAIQSARFVRLAVEMEVLRRAAQVWDGTYSEIVQANLAQQKVAVDAPDLDRFHTLDYEFHRLLCQAAGVEYAFEEIARKKAMVDRLCVLSLVTTDRMEQLLDDHKGIIERVVAKDAAGAMDVGRQHLSRLDATVNTIRKSHSDYFED